MRLWFLLFASLAVLFEAGAVVWWRTSGERRRKNMIKAIRAGGVPTEDTVKPAVLVDLASAKPRRFSSFVRSLLRPEDEAGNGGARTALTVAAASLAGFLLTFRFPEIPVMAGPLLGAAVGAAVPAMMRARKARKRLALIEEQFPEALDCLGRSVRAGNAFSVAIELLAQETSEPLKSEIRRMTRELALGARLEDAFTGFIARVPLLEVRFFVSAVLLQKETGGNLSEVLSKLAGSLRERFKLRGQVRAASGQGRLTAAVLTVLPVAIVILMRTTSPEYLSNLTDDPIGRRLLAGAAVCQGIGYALMKRIVNIEV